MSVQKYITFVASTPANSTVVGAVVTPDDNQERTVTGVLTGDSTKLNRTQIERTGLTVVDIDNSLMAQQAGFIPVNVVFKSGIQINVGSENGTAGAVNNFPITIQYTVPL